ncbi:MAG: DUF3047 domain-containing protein [Rhodospirillales bacterium]
MITPAIFACAIMLAGCAGAPSVDMPSASPTGRNFDAELAAENVFDAGEALFEFWTLVPVRGTGHWTLVSRDGSGTGVAVRGEARDSASGVMIEAFVDTAACPVLEWEWMVESVQATADLTRKETDDVAAAIMVLFGDPGTPMAPKPVPTLRYVWTGAGHPVGAIIANPYMPAIVKNIVVRNGSALVNDWQTERRDLHADYIDAFGAPPEDEVWAVGLFIDNDQTGEPAAARFSRADVYCKKR